MGLLNYWFASSSSEKNAMRPMREQESSTAIRLEERLVLGSLTPLPTIGEMSSATESQSGTTHSESDSTNTPLEADQSTYLPAESVNRSDSTVESQEESSELQRIDGEANSDSLVGSGWNAEMKIDSDSDSNPDADIPQSGAQSLAESTPNEKSSNTPVVGTDRAVPNSPPVETPTAIGIDSALQNRNPGILVNPQTIKNGYQSQAAQIPWFDQTSEPVVIHYDFRDQNGTSNEITAQQMDVVNQALQAWTDATGGRIEWVRDTTSAEADIVNIGVGDLSAVGLTSAEGGTLGVGGSALKMVDGSQNVLGTIWLDKSEHWDNVVGNGDVAGTVDLYSAVAHEAGHVIGIADDPHNAMDLMYGGYVGERSADDVANAFHKAVFFPMAEPTGEGITGYSLHSLVMNPDQLSQLEVNQLLDRASLASSSNDGIIAIVDRNGTILGVRVEQDVLDQYAGNDDGLIFAIDGAVAKARTAAFFANDSAALTSRTVRFISQSTVTQREVEGNPSSNVTDPTIQGPGFVAPIGLGGHFPPDVANTPPVDLFGIEHTNRDSRIQTGPDGLYGTADDIGRFNIDPTMIPADPNNPGTQKNLVAPLSYGVVKNQTAPDTYTSRGVATLPGGIPIYRDTDGNAVGDKLIGGIGVFFPGTDGYATHEQGFVAGQNQTTIERTNSDRSMEAEFIALAAIGGSQQAFEANAPGAKVGAIGGIPPVPDIDLPFGNLALVGINLQGVGDIAGIQGIRNLLKFARTNLSPGTNSGANQFIPGGGDGAEVPDGDLVKRHGSSVDNLTQADVSQIIDSAIAAANKTRAAIRLTGNGQPGASAKMVISITDTTGEVLGLYRMQDATVFSIDVAVAKARNVSYYADAAALQPIDQVPGIAPGTAFTNRTFRFLSEARFPDGVDGSTPPVFSILADATAANIDPKTGENLGAPADASVFQSVLGYDAFHPGTNFRDPDNPDNQNGIVFFPGSTPLYKNGVLIGGLGISGDGVDQDDIVTYLAAQGYLPEGVTTTADQTFVNKVRLPYQKFNRNPFALI